MKLSETMSKREAYQEHKTLFDSFIMTEYEELLEDRFLELECVFDSISVSFDTSKLQFVSNNVLDNRISEQRPDYSNIRLSIATLLAPKYAKLLELRYFQDMKYREIGNCLGISRQRAKQLVSYSVSLLKSALDNPIKQIKIEKPAKIKREKTISARVLRKQKRDRTRFVIESCRNSDSFESLRLLKFNWD